MTSASSSARRRAAFSGHPRSSKSSQASPGNVMEATTGSVEMRRTSSRASRISTSETNVSRRKKSSPARPGSRLIPKEETDGFLRLRVVRFEAERRGADRAPDEDVLSRYLARPAGQLDPRLVDLRGLLLQAERLEFVAVRAERVRLDDSCARLDVFQVNPEDDVRMRQTGLFRAPGRGASCASGEESPSLRPRRGCVARGRRGIERSSGNSHGRFLQRAILSRIR